MLILPEKCHTLGRWTVDLGIGVGGFRWSLDPTVPEAVHLRRNFEAPYLLFHSLMEFYSLGGRLERLAIGVLKYPASRMLPVSRDSRSYIDRS